MRKAWGIIILAAVLTAALMLPDRSGVAPPTLRLPVNRGSAALPAAPRVRVLLTPAPVATERIQIDGPFRILDFETGASLLSGESLAATSLTATASGVRLGKREFRGAKLLITTTASPALWCGDRKVRGDLIIHPQANGRLRIVNRLPIEEYLPSVLDGEMPASFGDEARKAQGVAARTYVLYQARQAPSAAIYDVSADVKSQKYLGYQYHDSTGRLLAGESAAARTLIAATRGIVLTHEGELFSPYYSAVCGGSTVAGPEIFPDAGTLPSVRCGFCQNARLFRWTVSLSKAEADANLLSYLKKQGKTAGRIRGIEPAAVPSTGRLPQFRITTDAGTLVLDGHELRQAWLKLGVSSPQFSMKSTRTEYVLSGQGHGHGVGLCQWGAAGMAARGHTATQILQHYYPHATLQKLHP